MRKKTFRSPSAILALGVFTAAAAIAASPAEEGTAAGTLKVGTATTPLAHAYARAEKGFFDKKKEDIRVILTDVALPESALADEFERHHLAEAGKLHGIEVVIDAQKQPIAGVILHAFTKSQGFISVTGMHRFQQKTFNATTVEGTLAMEGPSEFQGTTFQYSASFRAPVWHAPAPTAKGAAARETPPAKAVLAFYVAIHKGDLPAVKSLMTPESAKPLDGPNGKKMFEFLRTVTPEPARAQIESVDIKGNTAEVTVAVKTRDSTETSKVRLEKRAGQWKVAM